MDILQIITIIIVLVGGGVGIVLGARKMKEASIKSADALEKNVDDFVYDYTDDIINIARDVIVITGIKREDAINDEEYEEILLRMIAERLERTIYDDIEIDERFKQIINQETLLAPLRYFYIKYKGSIDKAVVMQYNSVNGVPSEIKL